ncbi:MAG: hypothetical protein ROW48_06520 [Bellilinea sp.]|jgi:hypothetical protein
MQINPQRFQAASRRWAFYFALALILLTSIPYLAGGFLPAPGWVFSGFVFGVEDGNSYIAKMLAGSAGDWLFKTPYTAFPQQGVIAFIPYLLLGKLAPAGQHEQLVVLFHLFRLTGILACVVAVYDFAGLFLRQENPRRLAVALAVAGGGLGWLSILGVRWSGYAQLPLEFYSPETFGFLSVLGLPHLLWARALFLWGLATLYRCAGGENWRLIGFKTGMLWLALGLFQPVNIPIAWLVGGTGILAGLAFQKANKTQPHPAAATAWQARLKAALLAGAISSPLPVYSFFAYTAHPFLRQWMAQNIILSPPAGDYLLSLAPALLMAVVGAAWAWRERLAAASLAAGWLLLFPLLAYAPHNLQRRFPEAIWVLISILAVAALTKMKPRFSRVGYAVLISGFVTTLILYAGSLMAVLVPAQPVFIPKEEVNAFRYIRSVSAGRPVVLANFHLSNRLPAWAFVHTITGHGPESMHLAQIQPRVERFFSNQMSATEAADFLAEQRISYVLTAPQEQFDAAELGALVQKRFQDGGYRVYEVFLPGQPGNE